MELRCSKARIRTQELGRLPQVVCVRLERMHVCGGWGGAMVLSVSAEPLMSLVKQQVTGGPSPAVDSGGH